MKHFKKKKKGSITLEFLVILPLFVFVGWAMMNIIFYTGSMMQVNSAADDAARTLSMEMRGNEGTMPTSGTAHNVVKDKLLNKIKQKTDLNNLILLFEDKNGNRVTPEFSFENKSECLGKIDFDTTKRIICAYTEVENRVGVSQEQIVVQIKAPFKIIGNGIPGLKLFTRGQSASTKDIPGRFQYYD